MTARLIALALWVALAALALMLPARPTPLAIEDVTANIARPSQLRASPASEMWQPDFMLLAPCPLTTRNLPKHNERIA